MTGSSSFRFANLEGEIAESRCPVDLESELRRICDPGSAARTLHWGRNYLYTASWPRPDGGGEVVVKQFRNQSRRARLHRRLGGSKAKRSWLAARVLQGLGVGTPQPVLFADSIDPAGPSYFVSEHRPDLLEVRYVLRSLSAGTVREDYPELDVDSLLARIAALARALHDAGFFHRDFSSGNVLLSPETFQRRAANGGHSANSGRSANSGCSANGGGLYLVDLNRSRWGGRLSMSQRLRDLSRMPIEPASKRRLFLDSYWKADASTLLGRGLAGALYGLYRRSFLLKNRSKKSVRGGLRSLKDALLPRRRPHVHIPPPSPDSSIRDRVAWDSLSDQPHQHASRWQKLRVRASDTPTHARAWAVALSALPRSRRRFRLLKKQRYQSPVAIGEFGVAVRPWPGDPSALLGLIEELGANCVLLRLQPWQDSHAEELELSKELASRGYDLCFALPQTRELVRDRQRWRSAVLRLAESFAPYGRTFQVGQAVNRSKWGVWRPSEYVNLFQDAAEALRAQDGVRIIGPGVIDFEPHATATFLNLGESLEFDVLASLLYVDRRGAPENRQLGMDTADKTTMLKALAETSRNCPSGASWITESNWPLREGPHAPAGRDVAVSEEDQANFLVRYYLESLCTGHVERVYWWQIVHKGYGLVDPGGDVLRRRPSFLAMRQMVRMLSGSRCLGKVGTAGENQRLYRFSREAATTVLVGWSIDQQCAPVEIPAKISRIVDRDGSELESKGSRFTLSASPIYIELE